jgi:endonuclease/exonuclease/phosphatase family metal-dependent hydrolase
MAHCIVSWNMNHWQRSVEERRASWEYLEGHVRPHVALLQETVPLDRGHKVVFRKGGIGDSRPWSSAVVSYAGRLTPMTTIESPYGGEAELLGTWPGSVAIAEVALSEARPLIAISVYGVIDKGHAITTMHKIVSDLTVLFDRADTRDRIFLAGDFNLSTQCPPPDRERHRNFFERLEQYDLVDLIAGTARSRPSLLDCPCEDRPCRHARTHVREQGKDPTPWQNDYVFVSKAIRERVRSCEVRGADDPDPWQLSDHCPIIVELET